jgi:hypothetical protein
MWLASASRIAVSCAICASISATFRLAIGEMLFESGSLVMTSAISSRLSPRRWALLIIRSSVTVCAGYCRCPEAFRSGSASSPRRS